MEEVEDASCLLLAAEVAGQQLQLGQPEQPLASASKASLLERKCPLQRGGKSAFGVRVSPRFHLRWELEILASFFLGSSWLTPFMLQLGEFILLRFFSLLLFPFISHTRSPYHRPGWSVSAGVGGWKWKFLTASLQSPSAQESGGRACVKRYGCSSDKQVTPGSLVHGRWV